MPVVTSKRTARGKSSFEIMKLRDYQQSAIDQIRAAYARGTRRVLLHLATGAGKTLCFCHIMKSAADKNKKCVMIVRGRELVDQASDRLGRENVSHGVLMAGHWRQDFNNPVQVCSIDTLRSRKYIPDADLVVVDEAHLTGGASYAWILQEYRDRGAYILAVTATPHMPDGLRHLADEIIYPITMRDLINRGHLVPPIYYAPTAPDLSGVKITRGEFEEKGLIEAMGTVTGDLITNYRKYGESRAAICFAVNIEHSIGIVRAFNEAGIPAEHIEAATPENERKAVLKRLESGATRIISNVGILTTGVDMPYVKCLIMARPTKSYNLYIQMAGRGTRTYPNKNDFILLDHAGNIERHGFIESERLAELDPQIKKKKKNIEFKIPAIRTCTKCFAVFAGHLMICPRCGLEQEIKPREIMHVDGELSKISAGEQSEIHVKIFINEHKEIAKRKAYKPGWVYHQVKSKFGDEIAAQYFPKRILPPWVKRRAFRSSQFNTD